MFARRHLVVLLALACAVALGLVAARPTTGAGHETRYVVRPGDTLWEIATARYAGDPREAVWRIERRNGLENAGLAPGQVLALPP